MDINTVFAILMDKIKSITSASSIELDEEPMLNRDNAAVSSGGLYNYFNNKVPNIIDLSFDDNGNIVGKTKSNIGIKKISSSIFQMPVSEGGITINSHNVVVNSIIPFIPGIIVNIPGTYSGYAIKNKNSDVPALYYSNASGNITSFPNSVYFVRRVSLAYTSLLSDNGRTKTIRYAGRTWPWLTDLTVFENTEYFDGLSYTDSSVGEGRNQFYYVSADNENHVIKCRFSKSSGIDPENFYKEDEVYYVNFYYDANTGELTTQIPET